MLETKTRTDPRITKFLLPTAPQYFPTRGLTIANATEYTQKIIPTKLWSTPLDAASAGKNGAITA